MKSSHCRRGAALLLGAALQFSLTACAPAGNAPTPPPDDGLPAESVHVLGLTAKQRMEDYEYFWSNLRDSYPCWGILEREGVNVDAIYREYKDLIAENDSDVSFYSALYSSLWRLGQNGHLRLVEPPAYEEMRASIAAYRGSGQARWAEIVESPATVAGYERLSEMMALLDEDGGADGSPSEESAANVTTLLLPGMGAAYVKIDSFVRDIAADKSVLDAFYGRLEGYSDLIIDLTANSGGSELYWQDLLVAPNIDAPLSCENYALTRMSENNRPYLENVFRPDELIPIDRLPDLPGLAPEDRALATHFVKSTLSVSPAPERSPFRGRVWVLVGELVYSASESFAVFCQQTGFATLVGTQTGGDGIGALDPILLQLPNSGILIRFTALFGLNPDGGSNEEHGTTPDVLSPENGNPLVTALRAIQG